MNSLDEYIPKNISVVFIFYLVIFREVSSDMPSARIGYPRFLYSSHSALFHGLLSSDHKLLFLRGVWVWKWGWQITFNSV
jgi:hypothetical protein